ncbi:otoancorin [Brachyistius frenatus]|uniref:otoancorin n=1 Tax=Brachyistius frenatus TaxID=100188 RepID=UPI0037E87823
MAPKGGTWLLLLILACAALAMPPNGMHGNNADFKDIAKKLMMKCQKKGYPVPTMGLLKTAVSNSDLPVEDRNADQSNTLLFTFKHVLNLVTGGKKQISPGQRPLDVSDIMPNKMWNSSMLVAMIKGMRNSSESFACYMQAFMAPLSWATVCAQTGDNVESNDYDTLLSAAKTMLQDIPSTTINLPTKLKRQKLKDMMNMLQEVYDLMSNGQRTQVVNWAKEQITQNNFNCTMSRPSKSRSMAMDRCQRSLEWLDSDALDMMGPYISRLTPEDVDSSPKEKLCEFFHSAKLKSSIKRAKKMQPSLSKKILQRIQECDSQKEFSVNVDRLGLLACYLDAPELTPDFSRKLLPQLDNCSNPTSRTLKKRLVKSVMSSSNISQALQELGTSITLLPLKQFAAILSNNAKELLINENIRWTKTQLRLLVKKVLSNKTCNEVSSEDLWGLQSVQEGLSSCVLKNVKPQEILSNTKALKNITKRMRKGQLKAMMQGLRKKVDPSELVQKLPGRLLRSISINSLDKANITSLDQVESKTWTRPQAAYLAKKMHKLKQLKYRRLHSIWQGITCKMIDEVADDDAKDMADAITENPQWLSKVQAGCAARKLFSTLEKNSTDYFKTITEEELKNIPTSLFIHLQHQKVKDLPDSVCPVFLDKMETANLSSLSPSAPSRLALIRKALSCLTNGTDLSGLTTEDVSRLGPLLCEMPPSKLRLMAPDVLNSSLQVIASCQHIPPRHREDLMQLVNQNFGSPSDWSAETMELLGPLVLLDDNATSALPNKPWMKDVLYFLKSRLPQVSDLLNKKLFELTTTTSNSARKKRSVNSKGNGNCSARTERSSDGRSATEITEALIEELGENNVFWTKEQLDMISKDTFLASVEKLGEISEYSANQLAVLSQKVTEAFGSVSEMDDRVVMQLGCLSQGFSTSDLEKLPFSLDSLEDIARCGWNELQLESVWKAFAKRSSLTAQQLDAADMVALNRFICGLNSSELGQLNVDAFKDAVGSMDGIQCSLKDVQQLKTLAVSAFGDPSTWTEAQVSDLDNIVAGLNTNELASLDPPVFSFLSETCIPLFSPQHFAALSGIQLAALGPDNAAMVTSEQRAVLTKDQLAALNKAMTGSQDEQQRSSQSGAPSLSVEGISACLKPLLFLLMGFLLL